MSPVDEGSRAGQVRTQAAETENDPSLLLLEHAEPEQQPTAGASGRDSGEEERTHEGIWVSKEPHRHSRGPGPQGS